MVKAMKLSEFMRSRSGKFTVWDIAEVLDVHVRTARRWGQVLQDTPGIEVTRECQPDKVSGYINYYRMMRGGSGRTNQ